MQSGKWVWCCTSAGIVLQGVRPSWGWMDVWEDAWIGSVGRQTEHTVGLAPDLFVSGSEVLLVTQLALQAGSHCLRTGHKEWIFIFLPLQCFTGEV